MRSAENIENDLLDPRSSILDPALFDPRSFTQQLGASPLSCAGKTSAVSIPDPASLQRIRWRCRRGMLELDIILGRFVDAHYERLSQPQRETFEEFLDMADNPLWDLISGKIEAASEEEAALTDLIRSA
jgi:antitoxin CptB